MLKITLYGDEMPPRMVLEGKLAGAWVDEASRAWRSVSKPESGSLVVDLDGIDYVDRAGKDLLAAMWHEGARLRAAGCCTRFIIEEITKSSCESA